MHELSIAQSLVELVEDELQAENSSDASIGSPVIVRRVVIRVGVLSGVVIGALQTALSAAVVGTRLADAQIDIIHCAAIVWCEACCEEKTLESLQSRRCPSCGQPASRLVGGRELELASIEVVETDSDE